MQTFQYKHGDRPLEGFTVQRAIGRGGFGEVYFAVSDSGREVALKAVQGYEQIELRGIGQCMNLKSPHLVTIFDIRHNDQGKPFVIMEYVAGPSLRELLDESPGGLGTQKAAFFLREIAKGMTYLHDRGIVHRDLKPGNIFYEDGYVKIGDYGLSKAMSASFHSGQTITVGTVHYMAPEIGTGHYDRSIDIYALGVILYEMLTGVVPYLGASPGEVLMKHLSAQPDLTGIEEPFATAIRRALAKEPAERFATVQEMVESVFGAEHVRQSVSAFSPDSLSMVAGHVAAKAGIGGPGSSGQSALPSSPPSRGGARGGVGSPDWTGASPGREPRQSDVVGNVFDELGGAAHRIGEGLEGVTGEKLRNGGRQAAERVQQAAGRVRDQVGRAVDRTRQALGGYMPGGTARSAEPDPKLDPIGRPQRRLLAMLTAAVVSAGVAWLSPDVVLRSYGPAGPTLTNTWSRIGYGFLAFSAIVGGTFGILWARMRLGMRGQDDTHGFHRIVYGPLAIAAASLLSLPILGAFGAGSASFPMRPETAMIFPIILLMNWRRRVLPGRRVRVSFWAAMLPAALAFVIVAGMGGQTGGAVLAAGVLAGISLSVQTACPFDPTYRRRRAEALATSGVQPRALSEERGRRPSSQGACRSGEDAASTAVGGTVGRGPGVEESGGDAASTWGASPRTRLAALLLALLGFIPVVSGLHRFYVGKVGTGILWLVTGGLFGVGTIFDVILILVGGFTDKQGRPLLAWHGLGTAVYPPPSPSRPVLPQARPLQPTTHNPQQTTDNAQQTVFARSSISAGALGRIRDAFLATLGMVLLLLACLLGAAVAMRLPSLLQAGWPSAGWRDEFEHFFDSYANWPGLLERVVGTMAGALLMLSVVFLLLARRSAGAAHLLRAAFGIAGVFITYLTMRGAWLNVNWTRIADLANTGQRSLALDTLLQAPDGESLIFGLVFLVLSVLLLAWPAERTRWEP